MSTFSSYCGVLDVLRDRYIAEAYRILMRVDNIISDKYGLRYLFFVLVEKGQEKAKKRY